MLKPQIHYRTVLSPVWFDCLVTLQSPIIIDFQPKQTKLTNQTHQSSFELNHTGQE